MDPRFLKLEMALPGSMNLRFCDVQYFLSVINKILLWVLTHKLPELNIKTAFFWALSTNISFILAYPGIQDI